MQYNFDEIISRKNTSSLRWDTVWQKYGEPDLIPLTTADMDFRTAPAVIHALREAVERGIFGYPAAMDGYFEAVMERMEQFRGWHVDRDWICRSPGIVNGVAYIIQGLTKPGDRIVLPSPMYHPFAHLIADNGRELSRTSMILRDGRYELDFQDLEKKLADSRASLLIFCSPHNPSGRVFTRSELEQVIRLCRRHQVLLLCDEIHSDFCFSGHPFVSAGQAAREMGSEYEQNLIVCTSASKSFNIAGLQNSDILIPNPSNRAAYNRGLTSQHLMSCNYLGILATEAAYRGGQDWLKAVTAYPGRESELSDRFYFQKLQSHWHHYPTSYLYGMAGLPRPIHDRRGVGTVLYPPGPGGGEHGRNLWAGGRRLCPSEFRLSPHASRRSAKAHRLGP